MARHKGRSTWWTPKDKLPEIEPLSFGQFINDMTDAINHKIHIQDSLVNITTGRKTRNLCEGTLERVLFNNNNRFVVLYVNNGKEALPIRFDENVFQKRKDNKKKTVYLVSNKGVRNYHHEIRVGAHI